MRQLGKPNVPRLWVRAAVSGWCMGRKGIHERRRRGAGPKQSPPPALWAARAPFAVGCIPVHAEYFFPGQPITGAQLILIFCQGWGSGGGGTSFQLTFPEGAPPPRAHGGVRVSSGLAGSSGVCDPWVNQRPEPKRHSVGD